MKKRVFLVLSVCLLGALGWTGPQIERDLKQPSLSKPQISSVSQRNLADDIEIVVAGTQLPTALGYQIKFGDHILARPSAWTQTRATGTLPHNILGAETYPVSIINSISKQAVSNSVQYFLLYNLTGYNPKFGVGPGTVIHVSTTLGFEKVNVSKYAKFDGQSIWPGFNLSSGQWTIVFDIPQNVAVPSTHSMYLWESGKTISNTITINVTGKPPIINK